MRHVDTYGVELFTQDGNVPEVYRVTPPDPRPWIKLAIIAQQERADTCILGDQGALFHEVAFGAAYDSNERGWKASILLGIFRRAEGLVKNLDKMNAVSNGGLSRMLKKLTTLRVEDVTMLQDNLWACLAIGCKYCRVMMVSGLCIEGLDDVMRHQLL